MRKISESKLSEDGGAGSRSCSYYYESIGLNPSILSPLDSSDICRGDLLVNSNILPFVTIANIAWYYPTAIATRAPVQPVTYVSRTGATAKVTSHSSHSPTSPTGLPLLNRHWVTVMLYMNCLEILSKL